MSRSVRPLLFAAALAGFASAPVLAAAETIAITGARIETAGRAGAIAVGTVVIVDGRIAAVGASVPVPRGARVIDAAGKVVTPGLVAAATSLTVAEIEGVAETRDDRANASAGLTAGFDVGYGVNPDSTMIALARQGGVTRAVVMPQAAGARDGHADDGDDDAATFTAGGGESAHRDPGLFGGQAAAVRLADGDAELVFKPRLGVVATLRRGGPASARGAVFVLLRSALADARLYARNRAMFDRGAEIPSESRVSSSAGSPSSRRTTSSRSATARSSPPVTR